MTFGTMIDCTGGNLGGLLAALGSNVPDTFATYVTGSGGVQASQSQLSALAGKAGLFRYDQSPALNAFGEGLADAADIEDLAGTFPNAVGQTKGRESKGWFSWWYFSDSELGAARQLVEQNGFKRVQFVVANWALSQAQAQEFLVGNTDVSAVQWASPSSNPNTVCPGTNKTLSQLNCDLNVTRAGWFIKPVSPVAPAPKYRGVVVSDELNAGELQALPVSSNDGKLWAA